MTRRLTHDQVTRVVVALGCCFVVVIAVMLFRTVTSPAVPAWFGPATASAGRCGEGSYFVQVKAPPHSGWMTTADADVQKFNDTSGVLSKSPEDFTYTYETEAGSVDVREVSDQICSMQ